ncbi:MAG: hypothetical protein IJ193_08050 [Bacilli bacterium]|nr:hypothetical protein [Bacilli bacterium]
MMTQNTNIKEWLHYARIASGSVAGLYGSNYTSSPANRIWDIATTAIYIRNDIIANYSFFAYGTPLTGESRSAMGINCEHDRNRMNEYEHSATY